MHVIAEFKNVPGYLDLSTISSVEDLQNLGMQRITSALKALGLKCG